MREEHVCHLACPGCRAGLALARVDSRRGGRVEAGTLRCRGCGARYPVAGCVPRFVPDEGYAASFGFEWRRHPLTQFDSRTGVRASTERFFGETGWPRKLRGEAVLEVGSGAGRFTEVMAAAGAMVVSVDASRAVEVNQRSNGWRRNVLVVQGDLFALPVRDAAFDRVFCGGVLQHTPSPRRAFLRLLRPLRPGGSVAVDVYALRWRSLLNTKYWVRPLTRLLPAPALHRACEGYAAAAWPLVRRLGRSRLGRRVAQALLFNPNAALYPLSDAQAREWAVLDLFDMLSPAYDRPRTLGQVRRWLAEAGLGEVVVRYGWNGVEARGVRPGAKARAEVREAGTLSYGSG
jgi:SAM-dependent methyltransferase